MSENIQNKEQKSQKPKLPKGVSPEEAHLVHFTVERKAYDKGTGKKISVPRNIKMNPKSFGVYQKQAPKLGYSVSIIHKPKS